MTPRLIIFDCDGTIVDSQHRIAAAMTRAFLLNGLPEPERQATLSVVGLSLIEAARELAPDLDMAVHLRLAEAYKAAFFEMREKGQHETPLYPGAEGVLRQLAERADFVLGIATGKSRRGVDSLIAEYGFDNMFMTIQTADDHPSKPHPSMIERALAETGIEALDTVMIGDTSYDMKMAASAGVAALGVAWGYHEPHALMEAGAHSIAEKFSELPALIDRVFGPARGERAAS
ncbi:MAG: HAD-IA family hydrolase [Rhodobiaceae bacterium]|nr:HAD-IA family hydrolase [Rhodobiaceae bacterium]